MSFSPYVPLTDVDMLDVIRPEQSCAPRAPRSALHRTVKDAVDSAAPTVAAAGMNMELFGLANIAVVPTAGAPQPNIEVLRWSEGAGAFVSYATPKTASAPAANTPYSEQFAVSGEIIWVKVTGTMALNDSVEIIVSGANLENQY